jgi:hypothetical protein
MVWFKVDDTLPFHAKVVQAGNAAMGLWVRAGAWSAQQLTDGHIPLHIVSALGNKKQAERLVLVGLWVALPDGYRFHQWNEDGRQPTRASVEKERGEARERMRKAREEKRLRSGEVRANTGRSSGDVRSTRPDPTRPDPTFGSSKTSQRGVTEVDARQSTPPPRFPEHCDAHANTAKPGKCGECADARRAARALTVVPDGTPWPLHCGECDENRQRQTQFGVIRCPECHPLAEESA